MMSVLLLVRAGDADRWYSMLLGNSITTPPAAEIAAQVR
jgi:hypothetical protein